MSRLFLYNRLISICSSLAPFRKYVNSLFVALFLLSWSGVAHAGYWKIEYIPAGTISITANAAANGGSSLFRAENTGAGGTFPWPRIEDSDYPLRPGYYISVQALAVAKLDMTGSITAVLTWVPELDEIGSLPPSKIRILETSEAAAENGGTGPNNPTSPNGQVSNGLGSPSVPFIPPINYFGWALSSVGTKTSIIDNPERKSVVHVPTRGLIATAGEDHSDPDDRAHNESVSLWYWANVDSVKVDLDIDSNNDGHIDDDDGIQDDRDPESDEYCENTDERVGALISLNVDDDNNNDEEDYLDPYFAQDNDLEPLIANCDGVAPSSLFQLDIEGKKRVKVWRNEDKTGEITSWPYTFDGHGKHTLYIEGVAWGEVTFSIKCEDEAGKELGKDIVRAFVGGLGVEMATEAEVGQNPSVAFGGLPEGQPVEFSIFKNGTLLKEVAEQTKDSVATTTVDTSSSNTSPGDVYQVKVKADKGHINFETEPCAVIPGSPASITYIKSKNFLIADDNDSLDIELTVKDAYGNKVPDGTEVQIFEDDYLGESDSSTTQLATIAGKASTKLKAPLFAPAKFSATSGEATTDIEIPLQEVTAQLSSTVSSLRIDLEQSATVELTTNVSDGTPVLWNISNFDPNLDATAFRDSVAYGGHASISVSSTKAYVGPCVVSAHVGGKMVYTTLNFVDQSELSVEIDHRVLEFGASINGVHNVSVESVLNETGVKQLDVPYYGISTVTVRGLPLTTYEVRLSNNVTPNIVHLQGLDEDSRLVTNTEGISTFQICGIAQAEDCCGGQPENIDFGIKKILPVVTARQQTHLVHSAVWQRSAARGEINQRGQAHSLSYDPKHDHAVPRLVANDWTVERGLFGEVRVVRRNSGINIWNLVKTFFGADPPPGWEGVAGSMAGGYLIVGDIGALIKNGARFAGLSKEPVNKLEVTLVIAGFAADFFDGAAGAGVAVNTATNGARYAILRLPKGPFVNAVGYIIRKRLITDVDMAKSFATFLARATKGGVFRSWALASLKSPSRLLQAVRHFRDYDEAFIEAMTASWRVGIKSPRALAGAFNMLDDLRDISSAIKAEGAKEFILYLFRVRARFGSGLPHLTSALKRSFYFSAGYSRRMFLEDILTVIPRVKKSELLALISRISKQNNQGLMWELRLAADVVPKRLGKFILGRKFTYKWIKENGEEAIKTGEFDLITGNVTEGLEYFRAKISAGKIKSPNLPPSAHIGPDQLKIEYAAAVEDAKDLGSFVKTYWVAIPKNRYIPEAVKKMIAEINQKAGREVIRIFYGPELH